MLYAFGTYNEEKNSRELDGIWRKQLAPKVDYDDNLFVLFIYFLDQLQDRQLCIQNCMSMARLAHKLDPWWPSEKVQA